MFDLFRHYRIEPKLHRYAVMFSLVIVLAWLYFTFIEKAFFGKILSGDAQLVDFVLGLPLIFMFTVIVYACAYWICKWLVIFFLPHAMVPYSLENQQHGEEIKRQEETHGEQYWNKTEPHADNTDNENTENTKEKSAKNRQNRSD